MDSWILHQNFQLLFAEVLNDSIQVLSNFHVISIVCLVYVLLMYLRLFLSDHYILEDNLNPVFFVLCQLTTNVCKQVTLLNKIIGIRVFSGRVFLFEEPSQVSYYEFISQISLIGHFNLGVLLFLTLIVLLQSCFASFRFICSSTLSLP